MSHSFYQPKYITPDDVILELQGKIIISDEDPQYMSTAILYDKIAKAESLVELELSRIYHVPFCGYCNEPFKDIPDEFFYSSKQFISMLSLLQTCIFILDSYYAQSDGVRGDYARTNYLQRITELKGAIIDKDKDVSFYWKNPPLHGLKLNKQASYANAALPPPRNAVIGAYDFNKQAIQKKMTNPNANFWTPYHPWQ